MTPLRASWRLAQVAVLILMVRLVNRITPAEPVWKQVATGKRAPVGRYEGERTPRVSDIFVIVALVTALCILGAVLAGVPPQ